MSDGARLRIFRMPPADYDSGWQAIAAAELKTLTHGLGVTPDQLVVILDYQNSYTSEGLNQCCLGGADFGTNAPAGHADGDRAGAYWRSLTADSIKVYRRPEDTYAELVRVRIYRPRAANLPFMPPTLLGEP